MALFEFELARVEDMIPWETADGPSWSWFAWTDGRFRMPVGDQVLFEYTDEIMAHWGNLVRHADYQIAAFAREMLGSVTAGAACLPERVERLAADWNRLTELRRGAILEEAGEDADEIAYTAWRWLGERSPWASYLVANPSFHFVRVGDEVRIHWDNRHLLIDGRSVWTAQVGVHVMLVEAFVNECRDFSSRLLREMDGRIGAVEKGAVRAQAVLNPESLRAQHEEWRAEFDSYFGEYHPDIAWPEAELALQIIAEKRLLPFRTACSVS